MSLVKPRAGASKPAVAPRVAPRVGARPATRPAAAGSGFRFEYRGRTGDQVRERASRSLGGRDSFFNSDVQFFTPRVGDNNVRILPPPPEKAEVWGHYGMQLPVHYGIGADQSAYVCVNKLKGEDCVLCTERARAASAGEEELADALKPSYRVAVYVIDRGQEAKGPMIWNMPAGVDKDITKLCIEPGSGEVLLVDDPEAGYDLAFVREGEGMKTKYKGIQFSRKPSPLADDPDVAGAWLQYIVEHPIDESLVFHEQDYIAKVFEGQAPPPEAGTEAATPAPRRGPAPRGAAAKPAAAAAAPKPRVQPRGAAKPAPAPEPEPAPAGGEGWPTWEELEALDEDSLGGLIDEAQIADQVPADGFESVEALRAWVAEQLGIEIPAEEPAPAPAPAAGNWRDKLNALKKK